MSCAFWPTMVRDVTNYVNSCSECLQAKSYKQRSAGAPHSHLVPRERFEKITVDLLPALPVSKRGNDSVLVFLDQFSNRVFLYPCHTDTAAFIILRRKAEWKNSTV